jgi:hypothetical protein
MEHTGVTSDILLVLSTMSSSQQQQQQQQQQQEDHPPACFFDNPKAYSPLLKHPSICQEQQVLLLLQQTSKQLQAAIAEHCTAQLAAVVRAHKVQQLAAFCSWLRKHSHLLQHLDVQLISTSRLSSTADWSTAVAALAAALRDAAAAGAMHLQQFALHGSPASITLLQQLPAAQLTQLWFDPGFSASSSNSSSQQHSRRGSSYGSTVTSSSGPNPLLQQLASFTALRCLGLSGEGPAAAEDDYVLAPLASLQQLTELYMSPAKPAQLLQLQLTPKLQQLHLAVDLSFHLTRLVQLASWLEQHSSCVVKLELGDGSGVQMQRHGWATALSTAAAHVRYSAVRPASHQPIEITSLAGNSLLQQQQQALMLEEGAAWGSILRRLQPSLVKHLVCPVDFSNIAQMQALCELTALESLWVCEARGSLHRQPGNVEMLEPLSALQQLTQLRLERVRKEQLSQLQLPQLQQLTVELCKPVEQPYSFPGRAAALKQGIDIAAPVFDKQLQLGHLTALRTFKQHGRGDCSLQDSDILPGSLKELEWVRCRYSQTSSATSLSCSIQALLALSRLEQLHLAFTEAPAAWQLQQLGSLQCLQEVRLQYLQQSRCEAAAAAAWLSLPLKALVFECTAQCVVEAGVLEVIGELQGLTSLDLGCCDTSGRAADGVQVQGTLKQLAGAVRQLTNLRSLRLQGWKFSGNTTAAAVSSSDNWCGAAVLSSNSSMHMHMHTTAGVVELVAAFASLPKVDKLVVRAPVVLTEEATAACELIFESTQIALQQLHMTRCGLYTAGSRQVLHVY